MKTSIKDGMDTNAVAARIGKTAARVRQLRKELRLREGVHYVVYGINCVYTPAGIKRIELRNTITGWAGRKERRNGLHSSRVARPNAEKVSIDDTSI